MPNGSRNTEETFEPLPLARRLLRTLGAGALATLDATTGLPFASLTTVATDLDGSPLILVSLLSAHTRNLDADTRASLLLSVTGKGDALAHPRLTLSGRMEPTDEPRHRDRFLRRHPKAELYVDFPDFSFRRMSVERAHLNGGFARAAELSGDELRLDLSDAEALADAEAGAVEHMNTDHRDAIGLYATRLCGAEPGPWRAVGIDPEGMDLGSGEIVVRLPFPERIRDGGALRRLLVRLGEEARADAP